MNDQDTTPQAIEAEQSVIGSLLRDNGAVDRMGDLRATHFFRHDHRTIFSEIIRQITAGKCNDLHPKTLRPAFSGFFDQN